MRIELQTIARVARADVMRLGFRHGGYGHSTWLQLASRARWDTQSICDLYE